MAAAASNPVPAVDLSQNFWRMANTLFNLPDHLQFLYQRLYQRTHPRRTLWGQVLHTQLPFGYVYGVTKPRSPPSPQLHPQNLDSTWFRYCEEFEHDPEIFRHMDARDLFLNNELNKFDISFVVLLVVHSSVRPHLVQLIFWMQNYRCWSECRVSDRTW